MPTSQNGYAANDINRTTVMTIPGTSRSVRLRKGAPGELLCHLAAWFDKNIESVDGGILDDWGYAERTVRGSTTTLSNHASGTAIDLNAPRHPLGVRNTFTNTQEQRIRAQLRRYEGAIRWGGDYQNRADEMHFEIMATPEECARILDKVRREDNLAAHPRTPPPEETILEDPRMTHLEKAKSLGKLMLAELDKTRTSDGRPRRVVQAQAAIIRVALAALPRK